MTDSERDATILALGKYQHREFARLLVIMIGLAAEINPQELRDAFGKVFDLGAVEDMTRRAVLIATEAQQRGADAQELMAVVSRDVEDLEKRLDAMLYSVGLMEKRLKAMKAGVT